MRQDDVGNVAAQVRTGVEKLPGFVHAHVSRFARFKFAGSSGACMRCGVIIDTFSIVTKQQQGSVLTGEELPPHSGELKHALSQAGGPTQSQLSRPMSSGHHISMEHQPRRKHL